MGHKILPSFSVTISLHKKFLLHAIGNGQQVDAVYTDFVKAFDKVNHRLLLRKLKSFGIFGQLLL